MTLLRLLLLALLLCAACVEPERADVLCSDDYATDSCDNPQGYAGGSL